MIGMHQPFDNPMKDIIYTAVAYKATTFQIFMRNARSMKQRDLSLGEIDVFNHHLLSNGFSKYAIHAPYAMNPGSPDKSKRDQAVRMIKQDMHVLKWLAGTPLYVLHPGHHMGDGSDAGLEYLSEVLHEIGKTHVRICVETMSGAGSELLYTVSEVLRFMDMCRDLNVGVTFDTCHVFASGQDLESAYCLMKPYVEVIHLNGSLNMFQSYKDRHANLTKGCIPIEVLEKFCKKVPEDVPIILETPYDGILEDLGLLKKFTR